MKALVNMVMNINTAALADTLFVTRPAIGDSLVATVAVIETVAVIATAIVDNAKSASQ